MKKEQFLAMSLPSGIKVVCTDLIRFICEDVGIDTNRRLIEVLRGNYLPVLHPLSDLTNEITHNGETFVPIVELEEMFNYQIDFYVDDELSFIYSEPDCRGEISNTVDLSVVIKLTQKLIEWHFNLMDESEPFIDVNTLETNPYA